MNPEQLTSGCNNNCPRIACIMMFSVLNLSLKWE